jgi:WD40 repeat protein
MKQIVVISLVIIILLSACGVATPTLETSVASRTPPVPQVTASPLSAVPTRIEPTMLPTASPGPEVIPTPAYLSADNFSQFVQVQTYRLTLEKAVGKDIFDFRQDAIAYSPDGRYFAVGGCTGNWYGGCINDVWGGHSFLYILDAGTAKIVTVLPETEVTITGLAFSADGEKLIYATSSPDRIVIWDVATGKLGKVLWLAEGAGYRRVAISPDGSRIVDVSSTTLRVWDTLSGDLLTQKPGGNYGDKLPRFSADGSRLAAFSLDSGLEITIYDTTTWETLTVISLPYEYPGPVAVSPDFKLLATAEGLGKVDVLLWDGRTGQQVGSLHDPFWEEISSLGFTPDGRLLLVSGTPTMDAPYDQPFSLWDVSARQNLGRMFGPDFSYGRIIFSSDGTAFATGATLWSLPEKNVLAVRQALLDFTAALNRGDYATAAGAFQPYVDDASYFQARGVDTTDLPALLEHVCGLDSQPCMLVREILYAGKDYLGDYGLLVRFTAPDGSAYVDADGFDTFWMFAEINADGDIIFSSLPPFPKSS